VTAVPATTGELPVYFDTLIGRERDATAVRDLLDRPGVRLVTLTGPGGVGKTRLAAYVAGVAPGDLADAVAFVDLAPVDETDLMLPTVARTLGVHDPGDRPLADRIAAVLSDRRWLLVLDNFERLAPAAIEVARLLARCPTLRVLATSRVPLRIGGEHEAPVCPLAVPDPDHLPPLAELACNDAVALFLERARAVDPDISLSEQNAGFIAEICRRLGGLPLALELAAARVKFFAPGVLARRLEGVLPLLAGGRRDAPARHRTMRDAIAWSVDLLGERAATLFPRLAVFVGAWTLPVAVEVVGIEAPPGDRGSSGVEALLEPVLELAEHGLLRTVPLPDDEPAFAMLEVVREYALERLEASGEAGVVRDAHATHFLAIAEQARSELSGPDQAVWMARLHADYGNLRAALAWTLAKGDAETALRLGTALWPFWARAGRLGEGWTWLERGLAAGESAASLARARAVQSLGNLALDVAEYGRAAAHYEESLPLYREIGHPAGVASALTGLGLVAGYRGDYERAREWHEASLAQLRDLGDRRGEAVALHNLGDLANASGDAAAASSRHREALAIQQAIGDIGGVAYSTLSLAEAACDGGDPATAGPLFERSLALFGEIGDDVGAAYARFGLGRVAQRLGHFTAATGHYGATLANRREFGDRRGLVECVEGLAGIAAVAGRAEQAAQLLAAAAAAREALGAPLPAGGRAGFEHAVAATRGLLGASRFAAVWSAGQVLTLDEACSLAAAVAGASREEAGTEPPPATSVAPADDPYGLSHREREVLALLTEHLTDKEIAARLFLSHRTVMSHVRAVLDKLGVPNRRQAAALAVREHLV
jgi:predicted ATPase/DNA-binding CsgD family transcriptional regulator